jgi:hypothetical protein
MKSLRHTSRFAKCYGWKVGICLNYYSLVEVFVKEFPIFHEVLEEEKKWWDGELPQPHIFFGDVVCPYLEEIIKEQQSGELEKIFEFFERMATSNHQQIQEVLVCTILEKLGDDKSIISSAYEFMGNLTKSFSQRLEEDLGR